MVNLCINVMIKVKSGDVMIFLGYYFASLANVTSEIVDAK